MLEEIPLCLSFLGGGVAARDCVNVFQVTTLSPCSWDEIAAHVLCTVELLVLESWVPGRHQVVQDHACFDDDLDGGGVMLHGTQQNLESVCQNAEVIFYYPPGSGRPVVENTFIIHQTPEAVRLHQGIVADEDVGHIMVLVGNRIGVREPYGTIFRAFLQLRVIVNLSI